MSRVMELFLAALIIALVVSVGFNLFDNYVVLPQLQTDTNVRRTEALTGWLDEMKQADLALKASANNESTQNAGDYVGFAQFFAAILDRGSSEKLYLSIGTATESLSDALRFTGFGSSGARYSSAELSLIANLTGNLDSVLIKSASLPSQSSNMDPAQQLREVGVNMTNLIGCLDQITSVSNYIIMNYG